MMDGFSNPKAKSDLNDTIDPSEEVWVEIELLESIDGLQSQSFLNLDLLLLFLLHIITSDC